MVKIETVCVRDRERDQTETESEGRTEGQEMDAN